MHHEHPRDLQKAQVFCRNLVKREAKNFYYGFLLLPPPKRRAIFALYAFCRILDDAVDDLDTDQPADSRASSPEALRQRFQAILNGDLDVLKGTDRPIALALQKAMGDFQISPKTLGWIVDGVFMDFAVQRYQRIQDLYRYLFGVASAVGLACIDIFRYRSPAARQYAIYLGYAMQLTNIIRDVKEDYLRGRIYLPLADLRKFDVREEDFGREQTPDNVKRLLTFEADRADAFFQKAAPLFPMLARDAAPCPYALSLIYGTLLSHMRKQDFHVLEQRFSLPTWRKMMLMVRAKAAFLL